MAVNKLSDMDRYQVSFKGYGVRGVVPANSVGNVDLRMFELRLITGVQIILKNHGPDDRAALQVVDVDNIMGLGAGLVLGEYTTNWYFDDSNNSQGTFKVPYPATVYAGLYLRAAYTNTNPTEDAIVKLNYFLHKLV